MKQYNRVLSGMINSYQWSFIFKDKEIESGVGKANSRVKQSYMPDEENGWLYVHGRR